MRLILATHNSGKLVELREILAQRLGSEAEELDLVTAGDLHLEDPVETGTSFEENSLLKARFVAQATGSPAIADDSGLIVDFLGRAPGILSARWAGVHGDDAANNELLLRQLADIADDKRAARFVCCAALVVPGSAWVGHGTAPSTQTHSVTADGGWEVTRTGEMPGMLLREPRGINGFGYDPLFVPDDQPMGRAGADPLTSAELSAEQKNAISHRGKAFRALVPDIEELLG
ncbi:MAG: non-canonical purine NTP pyrophosphatase [Bifidobacteriaceae bacterium]|jgi:XTP/dITP diphosphohydrolase|nr:non-canonical purine NTP pyrophosphatase [Bifidobacteriaceae bacterium]MCI1915317.1 non-canonical purine NTP pyrophosphatase [Bifidobacteriaceae bacterium]